MNSSHNQRPAFTFIEVTVATAVLAILSTLILVNFTSSRRVARDARRREDIQTLYTAVNRYSVDVGTTFITGKAGGCSVSDAGGPTPATLQPAIGPSCTGAHGRAFGKMSLSTGITVPYNSKFGLRQYTATSIIQALKERGYLATAPSDPLSTAVKASSDPAARDYFLIRACSSSDPATAGLQHVGRRGSLFAVWGVLEGVPGDVEAANSQRYVGGSKAGPQPTDRTQSGYLYDFAAAENPFYGIITGSGIASGNGQSGTSAFAAPCDAPVRAS